MLASACIDHIVEGMIDAMRHRSAFKTIRYSEVWAGLVQSCTDFIEAQVADAAS